MEGEITRLAISKIASLIFRCLVRLTFFNVIPTRENVNSVKKVMPCGTVASSDSIEVARP
jgi:hypothetical protein